MPYAGHLAEMALAIDASALLIARAAWQQDKAAATTAARPQWPNFTQPKRRKKSSTWRSSFTANGRHQGAIVESLYREIRALRIYEGASKCSA